MLIKTKRQFYELASKGLCGNTLRTWWTYTDYHISLCKPDYLTIRSLVPGSSFLKPEITPDKIFSTIHRLLPETFVIQEVPSPTINRTLQGELTWVDGNWYFYHTFDPRPMRKALAASGRHMYGNGVLGLLQQYCAPQDFSELMTLVERYSVPGEYPVIELSVLRDYTLILPPGRNTLIWEVRRY